MLQVDVGGRPFGFALGGSSRPPINSNAFAFPRAVYNL
jgi:hypothetical protein